MINQTGSRTAIPHWGGIPTPSNRPKQDDAENCLSFSESVSYLNTPEHRSMEVERLKVRADFYRMMGEMQSAIATCLKTRGEVQSNIITCLKTRGLVDQAAPAQSSSDCQPLQTTPVAVSSHSEALRASLVDFATPDTGIFLMADANRFRTPSAKLTASIDAYIRS